ncbi:hypothetical protein GCM10007933_41270 [Zoogloea oryzae]|uniref:Tetratricopeptide repeat protein n=1 Tax=Zoogloea oryzae TaxID=310767 RepID=A0ABQ6FG99_9RHOO|nr:tetratricopeptide repeat protein [Zoogloea oryzae]GLT24638.1 hypothetical protein GCM10007933_41270 [Zoogloea oryzae]
MSEARSEVKVFLSTVSAEFRSYRDALRHSLDRPNVTVKVQEDFIATGTETLDMLDQYIRQCDVVIHLVGDMTGAMAQAPSVAAIRTNHPDFATKLPVADFLETNSPPMPYTQWEAWLALHHGKRLIIAAPEPDAPRDPGCAPTPEQIAAQQAHLARLASVERFPGIRFRSVDHLATEVWRSGLLDMLVAAGLGRRVDCLPYASLGALFMGRDADLDALAAHLGPAPTSAEHPTACMALWGLGGIGKTRLALEYAWRRGGGHHARLLLGASSPATLHANLAALCAPGALDLPEHHLTEEPRRHAAAIAWLNHHPGWLLILDNADDESAAAAVEALRARLTGGHILITSRLPNWSTAIHAREVAVLAPDSAADFLLLRTANRRATQPDDEADAARLAHELGYLALALEQAGAYIAKLRLSFGEYLERWQRQRSKVLEWFDPRLMQYHASVAITWQTSFEQLTPSARRLLQRLAWLAPAPIPTTLLDVPIPGENADLREALVELEALSLARFSDNGGSFTVHRLVQAVTQQDQATDPDHARLAEALQWVDDAFVGEPQDVRNWPILDPLADHAVAVADHGATNGLTGPCARLFNEVGVLLNAKAQYAEAESLKRRTLTINEIHFGPDHPEVATCLNNLATLLQATNRLAEAEPLMRRALAIDEASFGPDHPDVAIDLNNLAQLLQATNRLAEAEPLMRRALAIDEASFGPDHPTVATRLSNLASLLQATNRLAEAEPLIRRALAIDEASFGPDYPTVAIRLNNLAQLLKATSRLAEAEPLMRRALAIDEASFGPDHPDVAIDLNNLAQLLQATKRLAEAEPLMRRALAIDEASFGPDHPDVAIDLNNLAQLLQATDRLLEAEPLMRRALAIFIRNLGPDHPNSHIVGGNYIGLLHALGKPEAEIVATLRTLLK